MWGKILNVLSILAIIGAIIGIGFGIYGFIQKNLSADASDLNNIENMIPIYSLPVYIGDTYANDNAIRNGIDWKYSEEKDTTNFTAIDVDAINVLGEENGIKLKLSDILKLNLENFRYLDDITSTNTVIYDAERTEVYNSESDFSIGEEKYLELHKQDNQGVYYYSIKFISLKKGYVTYVFKIKIIE